MTDHTEPKEDLLWSNEINSTISNLSRSANISDLQLAKCCTPNLDDDVENHASRISIRIGCNRSRAMMLCDSGLFLAKMPRIAELALKRGCFSLAHIHAIAMAVYAVEADKAASVEDSILAYLHPQKDKQAIPGLRTFKRTLCDIVAKHDPLGVNDEEQPKDYQASETVTFAPALDGRFGEISARLRKDRAAEFISILNSIRFTESQAGRDCSWGDALMHLARGSASTKVVLNLYSPLPTSTTNGATVPPMWLEGAGWLDKIATQEWLNRLTDIRLSADSTVAGYTPSEAQIARVRGRDGTCSFPGCDVPASRCDIDHIKPYNRENPAESGPTSTDNLHCLCRRHHNLKTHHLWEVTAHADNSETWSSCDGAIVARSLPTGPLAGFGRQTFNQRLTRKAKTIRELNENNEYLQSEAAETVSAARQLERELRKHSPNPPKPPRSIPRPPF